MKIHSFLSVLSLPFAVLSGCNTGADTEAAGSEVVAKVEVLHQQMCACKDEACAKKLHDEMDSVDKSGVIRGRRPAHGRRGTRPCQRTRAADLGELVRGVRATEPGPSGVGPDKGRCADAH